MPDANSSGWHPDNVIQRMLDKKSSGHVISYVVLKHFIEVHQDDDQNI
jgi:hypothetical protein